MKAAVRRKYGAFADLKVEEIPVPVPRDTEVLIKVVATTVNRTDCAILTGKPLVMRLVVGLLKPKRPVPGSDFAGIIEKVGEKAGNWKVGERVFGFADGGVSSQAMYMAFPGKGTMGRIPEGIPFHVAAASLEGAHYAYNFLNKIHVVTGQKVMLNGATGAIGSAMLQFLKIRGVSVTATCATGNEALVLGMGADRVIDYLKEDFCQDKEKYDFVLDAVGKSRFSKCKPLLKPGGAYISSELGPNWENIYLPLTTKLFGKQRVVFPIPSKIKETIGFMEGLLGKREFKPLIDPTVYALDDIARAYEYAASGKKLGNIIVEIQDISPK